MREITKTYRDPLEVIWIHAAHQMGMQIERDSDVFASWDGQGTLRIGTPETLDADDSVAQMIFHETCHALVEGPDAFHQADWGLDITDRTQRVHEHACLRLQAALAAPYGLREFFAATTTFRRYYDALPTDAMQGDDDPAVALARPGFEHATAGTWAEPLAAALRATSQVCAITSAFADPDSLFGQYGAGADRIVSE